MKDSHPHLNISNREFDIIKTLCLATFYRYNVGNHEIDQLMDDLETYRKVIVTNKDEKPFTSRLKKTVSNIALNSFENNR
jgi:hemoglobin